ncbi:MAG: hypothetical protein A3F74_23240 [Betaproteobacteria bacterium RIFCSPLOWO2_12_FULL_62_58]|nr:MAG: hypothetical protein A3F74_23240 [Betaproteobacteria bacterium RIFCSPLOWO2_12_FULL_62_58]
MKEIKLTDVGRLKNELNKYKKGKKLDIRLFNQVARLAWLGKVVLCPLDPEDPECKAWLLHMQALEGLAAEIIRVDEDLNGMPFASQIHILDAEQGAALAAIFREGMEQRARDLHALNQRDFYFERFFPRGEKP